MEPNTVDVAVIGAGPAGLTAALALASSGVSVALIGTPASDNRTTALLVSSVTALETLGVWRDCAPHAAPLEHMRLVDDTGRLWRAPEAKFSAQEIGYPAFGWNIENRFLVDVLARRVANAPTVSRLEQAARAISFSEDAAVVILEGGNEVRARLIVGADGRRSLCRTEAGIATEGRNYPQTAVTVNFSHSRPHGNTSTEFHTAGGPFTVVPLLGQRSSLVCVAKPRDAEDLAARDDGALNLEIEQRSHSILGKISVEATRGKFPLRVEAVERFGAHRVALVGEAAHTLPPIGAQGFNLGLRDVATIAELVAQAYLAGGDVGAAAVTDAYHRSRLADTKLRSMAADALNRSLLSDFLPVQGLRGLGLYMIDRIGPLRRAVMREGVVPAASMPRLMRGETL